VCSEKLLIKILYNGVSYDFIAQVAAVIQALFIQCLNLHVVIDGQKNAGTLGTFLNIK